MYFTTIAFFFLSLFSICLIYFLPSHLGSLFFLSLLQNLMDYYLQFEQKEEKKKAKKLFCNSRHYLGRVTWSPVHPCRQVSFAGAAVAESPSPAAGCCGWDATVPHSQHSACSIQSTEPESHPL